MPDSSPDETQPLVILDDETDDDDVDDDDEGLRAVHPAAACARTAKTSRFAITTSSRQTGHNPLYLTLGRFRC
jgi:hypothetical protein